VVMVTRDMLYVNGEPVVSVADLGASEGQVNESLRAALGSQADGLLPGSEANREVTVMAEKSLRTPCCARSSRAVRRPSTPRCRSPSSNVNRLRRPGGRLRTESNMSSTAASHAELPRLRTAVDAFRRGGAPFPRVLARHSPVHRLFDRDPVPAGHAAHASDGAGRARAHRRVHPRAAEAKPKPIEVVQPKPVDVRRSRPHRKARAGAGHAGRAETRSRKKAAASGLLALSDQLAELRDRDVTPNVDAKSLNAGAGERTRVDRSISRPR